MTDLEEYFVCIREKSYFLILDTFCQVRIPNQDSLEGILEAEPRIPILDKDYAVIQKINSSELNGTEENASVVYLLVKPGTKTNPNTAMGETAIEYAAVWAENRNEWVGIKVRRREMNHGSSNIFERVICEGPYQLTDEWGKIILEAYHSRKFSDCNNILHTPPRELI
jgi:hypothetical protein